MRVNDRLVILSGVRVLMLAERPGRGDAADIVGAALEDGASWITLNAACLPEGFLDLASGVAGEIAQKCVNYRVGLAILGDIGPALSRSRPLRDWVRESNGGRHIWFLSDEVEFAARLTTWMAA